MLKMKNESLKLAWIGLHNVKRKSKSSKLVLGGLHKMKRKKVKFQEKLELVYII